MQANNNRLGLVSVSFRKSSPKEILEQMRRVGLSCIEWGSDVHAPACDVERQKELAALQKEYGITCCSYGTYFRLGETPMSELPLYIDGALRLGTTVLRLWCGTKSGDEMTGEERQRLINLCREAASIGEARGVTLCLECHKSTFTQNPSDAIALMEEIGSPHFRMYWQPFQWQSAEENTENARRLAPYAEHVHVFNWKGSDKFPLAEAEEEWRNYLNELTGEHTLLLEFMPKGTLEELAAETEALKRITGGTT